MNCVGFIRLTCCRKPQKHLGFIDLRISMKTTKIGRWRLTDEIAISEAQMHEQSDNLKIITC